jgi:HlyD family secretion protein
MVVYANEQSGMRFGGQQGPQVEEGATVRERQTILRLPDLSQMQVKVNVHETKVEQLRAGMRARIRILDRELQGAVSSIANQPEPTSFFSASVKEYATIVKVDGQPEGLRPGMTAEVEILVAHLKDVLTLPVAAVVEQRGKYNCWILAGGKVERRPLTLGMNNDRFVEVKDGVREGDKVLLNPRAVVAEARVTEEEPQTANVRDQFGEAKPGAGPPAADRPGSGTKPPGADGQVPGGPGGGFGAPQGPPGAGPGAAPGGISGGPGRGPRGPGGGFDLMSSDKDGDGKISKAEAPEFMQTFFDRVDTSGDGMLDKAEMDAMRRKGPGGGRSGSRDQDPKSKL